MSIPSLSAEPIKRYAKIALALCCISSWPALFAQNVGINVSGSTPSINAILDLNTGNHYNLGLIVPHVTLGASLSTFTPPIANVAGVKDTGMMVYNMNGSQPAGCYYWNGTSWVSTLAAANVWLINGNSNIVDGVNFLGTTNTVPLNFQINGNKAGRIDALKYNTFLGYESGNSTTGATTGIHNTGIGAYSLYSNTTGSSNTALGYYAGYHNTASQNMFLGYQAGDNNSSGTQNTFIGYQAGLAVTTADSNTAAGYHALYSNTTGKDNTAIGFWQTNVGGALYHNTTGNCNTAMGAEALVANTTGSYNTATGMQSGGSTTGSFNTCDGYGSSSGNGSYNTASGYFGHTSGNYNTSAGMDAFRVNTAQNGNIAIGNYSFYTQNYATVFYSGNIAIGNSVLYFNQPAATSNSGNQNTAIGYNALYSNTTGYQNTVTGYTALFSNTTGLHNTANGMSALYSNTIASSSTACGYYAGYNNIGSQNAYIGDSAGSANTSGTNNTFLGYQANANAGTYTNATAIGNGVTVTASNSIQIGNANVVFCGINGAPFNAANALSVGAGGTNGNGAYCSTGGAWTNASDRKKKENFSIPDGGDILTKVCALPVFRWNYKNEPTGVQHIGPMAQDFYKIFHTGNDGLSISTIDPAGIALIAVKELNKKLEEQFQTLKGAEIEIQDKIAALKKKVNLLHQMQASAN